MSINKVNYPIDITTASKAVLREVETELDNRLGFNKHPLWEPIQDAVSKPLMRDRIRVKAAFVAGAQYGQLQAMTQAVDKLEDDSEPAGCCLFGDCEKCNPPKPEPTEITIKSDGLFGEIEETLDQVKQRYAQYIANNGKPAQMMIQLEELLEPAELEDGQIQELMIETLKLSKTLEPTIPNCGSGKTWTEADDDKWTEAYKGLIQLISESDFNVDAFADLETVNAVLEKYGFNDPVQPEEMYTQLVQELCSGDIGYLMDCLEHAGLGEQDIIEAIRTITG
ncbi:TPA: hypothetical protein P0E36_005235 [Vibrio harveyi]|nr:hypothetical protein [Vibrio harveyi]